MTEKYDGFMVELEALLKKHQVIISVSEYDALQVWDYEERFHEQDTFEDRTKGSENI